MNPSPPRPDTHQFLDDGEVATALQSVFARPPFAGPDRETSFWRVVTQWRTEELLGPRLNRPVLLLLLALALLIVLVASGLFAYLALRRAARLAASHDSQPVRRAARCREAALVALACGQFRAAVEWAWALTVFQLEGARRPQLSPRQWTRRIAPRLSKTGTVHLARLLRLHELACYAGVTVARDEAREAVARAVALTGGEAELLCDPPARGAPAPRPRTDRS